MPLNYIVAGQSLVLKSDCIRNLLRQGRNLDYKMSQNVGKRSFLCYNFFLPTTMFHMVMTLETSHKIPLLKFPAVNYQKTENT